MIFRFPELSALEGFSKKFQPSTHDLGSSTVLSLAGPLFHRFHPMEVDLNRDVSNFEEVKKRVLATNVGP